MKKDIVFKIVLFSALLFLVILALILPAQVKDWGKAEDSYTIMKREDEDNGKSFGKREIYSLKPQPEDNLQKLDGDKDTELLLEFSGYETSISEWLKGEDWLRFQKELAGYLENKGLDVTTVRLHPESQQIIDDYVRYLYLDIDYQTEYSDTLLIKAVCDTYTDRLRFAFEVQYGD